MADRADTRRGRLLLWLLFLSLAVFLVARASRKRHGSIERNRDFAADVWSGTFPYQTGAHEIGKWHAPYPPSYGSVMGWLLLVPLPLARILWACLQLALLVLVLRKLHNFAKSSDLIRGPPLLLSVLTVLAISRYLLRDLAGGGGNLVYGAMVFLACFRPFEAHGEDRHPVKGVLLGLVLAVKPTPIFFLAWLALRARWRSAGIAILTAAALHLLPIFSLGMDQWARAYAHWGLGVFAYMTQQDVFADPAYSFPQFSWMNQGLRYCVARYLGTVPDRFVLDTPLFFQGAGLSTIAVVWISRILSASLLLSTFLAFWKRRHLRDGLSELACLSMLFCVTLLLSPITWKSHWVQAFPAFFLLLLLAIQRGEDASARKRLRVGLVLYFVACVLLSGEVVGDAGKDYLQSLYLVTFGGIYLWLECLAYLRRRTRSLSPPGAERSLEGSGTRS